MKTLKVHRFLLGALLSLASGLAQPQVISASSTGFYRNAVDNTLDSGGVAPTMFIAWNPAGGSSEFRDFAVFDLSSILAGQIITAAELRIGMDAFGYNSPNTTETVEWVQVTTAISTLTSPGYKEAVWTDLGDGSVYGTRTVSAADNGTTLVTTLNSTAISALNAAIGGSFAIGGHLTSIDMTGPTQESVFFNGNGQPVSLAFTLAVPEPETYAMLLAGLGLLGFAARRRKLKVTSAT